MGHARHYIDIPALGSQEDAYAIPVRYRHYRCLIRWLLSDGRSRCRCGRTRRVPVAGLSG